jgi:hypothetical protein
MDALNCVLRLPNPRMQVCDYCILSLSDKEIVIRAKRLPSIWHCIGETFTHDAGF